VRAFAVALAVAILGSTPAVPHQALDGEAVDAFLARVTALNAAVAAGETRAETTYQLGETVARIIDLLNRDRAMHGGESGLISTVLVNELKGRGIDLSFSPAAARYRSYLAPFESYLALAPTGERRADASFRLLQGRFYDSFVSDPFRWLDLDWPGLVAQIEAARAFVAAYPDHADKEEALFILAVDLVRAVRAAPDADAARRYREPARAALTAYRDGHPDSLRAVAVRELLRSLPAAD
jgi:hypothetical protein